MGTLFIILLIIGLCGQRRDREMEHERAMIDSQYHLELARASKARGVKIMEANAKKNPKSWAKAR